MTTTASGINTPHKKNVANTDRFMPMKPNKSSSDIFFPQVFLLIAPQRHVKVLPLPPTCKAETGRPIQRCPRSWHGSVGKDLIDLQSAVVRVVEFGCWVRKLTVTPVA